MNTAPSSQVEGFLDLHNLIEQQGKEAELDSIFGISSNPQKDDEPDEGIFVNCTADEWAAAKDESLDELVSWVHEVFPTRSRAERARSAISRQLQRIQARAKGIRLPVKDWATALCDDAWKRTSRVTTRIAADLENTGLAEVESTLQARAIVSMAQRIIREQYAPVS